MIPIAPIHGDTKDMKDETEDKHPITSLLSEETQAIVTSDHQANKGVNYHISWNGN